MKKLAVFASGSGTNFQAMIDAKNEGRLNGEIVLLVCDQPDAKAIERAKIANIPTYVFSAKDFQSKADFETQILEKLKEHCADFMALAGYMRLIGETLLHGYKGRIVNIHPSLLPSFPGKDAIGQAFQAGVKVSGVTIHYVDEGLDSGPIIAQEPVKIDENETIESLTKKIQAVEHVLYPATLNKLLNESMSRIV